MINLSRNILFTAIITIAFFSLISCEEDFNEVGGSLVDGDNFTTLMNDEALLDAENLKINKVQSNDLPSYALGVYNDQKYGKTTANVLAQLKLSDEDPEFGYNSELDSVVLVLPYFATVKSQSASGRKYKLDSVFGEGTIKLSVFRSNYFLRDTDPNDAYGDQAYYSDQADDFEGNLDGSALYTNDSYKPSKSELKLPEPLNASGEVDTTRLSPRLRVHLSKTYFNDVIMSKEGTEDLLTNENFKDYFRGLYFKAEDADGEGVMSLLNFNSEDAGIILYYTNEFENSDGETDYNNETYEIKFGDQIANVFDTEYDQLPATDDNLYLKGEEGSMAVVDLFTDEDQLESFKENDWLINEANLKLYVNEEELSSDHKNPERLMIYDVKNGKYLSDYGTDPTANDNDVVNSRTTHLGRLKKDDEGNHYYKLRVTDYLNNILHKDSTNTRLGIVSSQNVNIDEMSKVELDGDDTITELPKSEVISRNGTVIYGPTSASDKALKLEIHYTESN